MKCQFCGNDKLDKYAELESEITKKNTVYFICRKCLSIHQDPLPDIKAIQKYYDNYLKIKSKLNPGYLHAKNIDSFFKERDKTISEIGFNIKNVLNKSNVEVGAATGDFILYLKNHGAKDITAIDISNELLNRIKIKGIKKIRGDLNKLKEKSVDNLYMFNILEHFHDVNKEMKSVKSRLKKDGFLILEVPLSGFVSSLFSKKWRFLMPDEHLHIPSLKGLKIFLKKHNFRIIGRTRFGSGFTKGMINDRLKSFIDKFIKLIWTGDRGTFLIVNKK